MKSIQVLLIVALVALVAVGLSQPRMGYGPGGGGPAVSVGLQGDLHEEIAAFLGITPQELLTLHQGGKTIADIVKERGMDVNKLEARLIETRNAATDQALKDGRILAQQATQMKSRTPAVVTAALTREGGAGAGFSGNGGYGPRGANNPAAHCPCNQGGQQRLGPRWNR